MLKKFLNLKNRNNSVKEFCDYGAQFIHLVDLDGAKRGEKTNAELFITLAKTANVPLELGGGIRDMETIEFSF